MSIRKPANKIEKGDRIQYCNAHLEEPHPGINMFCPMSSTVLEIESKWWGDEYRYRFRTTGANDSSKGWTRWFESCHMINLEEEANPNRFKHLTLGTWHDKEPEKFRRFSIE